MTVSTTTNRITYTGDGSTTIFAFPYYFIATSDLVVYVAGVLKTLGVDYNVGTPSAAGANVTFTSAPASLASIVIYRNPDLKQQTKLPSNGPFPSTSVETMVDKVTLQVQRLYDLITRTLSLSDSDTSTASLQLPSPAADNLIGWNSAATGLQNVTASSLASTVAFGTGKADLFSGNGVTTAFTLSANPGAQANLDVAIGGVTQRPNIDFTWSSGTTLTFTSAPPAGVNNILARYVQAVPATGGLQISLNLSDLSSVATARTNLGLVPGTSAGNVIVLDGSAKLPAVDASQTTNRFPRGFRDGMLLSYSSATAVAVGAGKCRSGADDADITLSAFTKTIQAAGAYAAGTGQNGLFTGARANSTWYHVFAGLYNGTPDIGFDTSVTAANKPGTFTNVRLLGSVLTDGSGNIISFKTKGKLVYWDAMPSTANVNATNPGTAAVLRTMSTPLGRKVTGLFSFSSYNGSNNHQVLVTDPDQTDTAPTGAIFSWNATSVGAASISGQLQCVTNTSSQIRTRLSASGASDILVMNTVGWFEDAGENA